MTRLFVSAFLALRRLAPVVFAAAALIAGAVSGASAQTAPDPLIAKVNGIEIHQSDLALAEEEIGENVQQLPNEDAKREYLVGFLNRVQGVA